MAVIRGQLPTTDRADGTPGSASPAITVQVGGTDGTNLRTLKTDAGGILITSAKGATTPASPTQVSVAVTTTSAVASNANRKGLVLTNLSVGRISLAFGVSAVLNNGITLYPGGIYVMDEFTFNTSAVNAIASIAASVLSIQEFS